MTDPINFGSVFKTWLSITFGSRLLDTRRSARVSLNHFSLTRRMKRTGHRKDLCPDKRLFRWDKDHEFMQLDMKLRPAKPHNDFEVLRRRLIQYRNQSVDAKIREACTAILEALEQDDMKRYTPRQVAVELYALQETLRLRMKYPEKDIVKTIAEIQQKLFDDEIF